MHQDEKPKGPCHTTASYIMWVWYLVFGRLHRESATLTLKSLTSHCVSVWTAAPQFSLPKLWLEVCSHTEKQGHSNQTQLMHSLFSRLWLWLWSLSILTRTNLQWILDKLRLFFKWKNMADTLPSSGPLEDSSKVIFYCSAKTKKSSLHSLKTLWFGPIRQSTVCSGLVVFYGQ